MSQDSKNKIAQDLVKLVQDERADVQQLALDYMLQYFVADVDIRYQLIGSIDLQKSLLSILKDSRDINSSKQAHEFIVEMTSSELLYTNDFGRDHGQYIEQIVDHLTRVALSKESDSLAQLSAQALSNITAQSQYYCIHINDAFLSIAADIFGVDSEYSEYLAFILANLSAVPQVRQLISQNGILVKDIVQYSEKCLLKDRSTVRVQGYLMMIRNLLFISSPSEIESYHQLMIADIKQILCNALPLLTSPSDQYSDDDYDDLDQVLHDNINLHCQDRLSVISAQIRLNVLQLLQVLCCSLAGRTLLRKCGAYIVIKHLHLRLSSDNNEHGIEDEDGILRQELELIEDIVQFIKRDESAVDLPSQ
ncbi:hypothetical protein MP228_009800 [Amoeboaphelidium protococcarum]|nr:hypothetical protein MP228_009800 [Amoeboaphelidium protococcarum]